MTDSVYVFAPGERVTDSETGTPVIGGTLEFYDAGTTNPKTVYADADLSVAVGTSVVTDSVGYPTSDGTSKTLMYVGTSRYKIVIKDADDGVIATHDNIPGAVVSASSVDVSVTATFPVVTKSLDYSVLAADQNTTFKVNCSSADVTLTLPSAVIVGTGWKIKVQHSGTANQALIAVASGSGQLISEGSKNFGGAYALALNGEDFDITSDGGNWLVSSHTSPFLKVAQGIIPVVARVTGAPGSPVQGSIYHSNTSTTWGGVSVAAGDLVQWSGTTWVPITPYTDCGWMAFVAAENFYNRFIDSTWIGEGATTSSFGTVKLSTQATQEAGTDTNVAVTPGTQQWHPSAAKAWGKASVSGGTPVLNVGYNVSSITDSGVGVLTVSIDTDFSGANWAALFSIADGSTTSSTRLTAQSAGSATFTDENSISGGARDPSAWYWSGFGDQ